MEVNDQHKNFSNRVTFANDETEVVKKFLSALFKDLQRKTGCSHANLISFQQLLQIPLFVSEKIFMSIKNRNSEWLTKEDFIKGMSAFYSGKPEEKMKLIFKICDFNSDNFVDADDIRLLLMHFHMFDHTLDEIGLLTEVVEEFMSLSMNGALIDYEGFFFIISKRNSDVFYLFDYFISRINIMSDDKLKYFGHQIKKNDFRFPGMHVITNEYGDFAPPSQKVTQYIQLLKMTEISNQPTEIYQASNDHDIDQCENELEVLNLFEEDLNEARSALKLTLLDDPEEEGTEVAKNPKRNTIGVIKITDCEKLSNYLLNKGNGNLDSHRANTRMTMNVSPEKKQIKRKHKTIPMFLVQEKTDAYDANFFRKKECGVENDPMIPHHEINVYFYRQTKIKKCKLVLVDDVIFFHKFNYHNSEYKLHKMITLKFTVVKDSRVKVVNNRDYFSFSLVSYYSYNRFSWEFFGTEKEEINIFINFIKIAINQRKINDHYKIVQELGKGKFGKVFLGIRNNSDQKVAIKMIPKGAQNEDENLMLLRELDAFKFLKNAHHPNIVIPLEIFDREHCLCLVYEFISGGDLKDFILNRTDPISITEVKSITSQLMDALGFLHNFGIMHRDLKPKNILVNYCSNGQLQVKLIDFGFSRVLGKNETTIETYGSLCYTAPEILLGLPYNHNVDVWSLGVTLYYMIFKSHPFSDPEGDINNIKESIAYDELLIPVDSNNNQKDIMESMIRSCLNKNRTKRPHINELILG